jgi:hypothetical protein
MSLDPKRLVRDLREVADIVEEQPGKVGECSIEISTSEYSTTYTFEVTVRA